MGKAWIFNRPDGAGGLGHVGWAFQGDDGRYICGATENPKGAQGVGSSGDGKGWWAISCDPSGLPGAFAVGRNLPAGRSDAYAYYKVIDVGASNWRNAWNKALWCKTQPYLPAFRNCLDDTYDTLVAYGTPDLPWPSTNPGPNWWFDHINVPRQVISGSRLQADFVSEAVLSLPDGVAEAPVWRVPGTPEYEALQAAIKEAETV
jgi:hypothetical protein